MQIRLGKNKDSSAIKGIDSSIGSDPYRAELIDRSLQRGDVRVAMGDGNILGYSIVNRSFFHRTTLEILMVAQSCRGKGVGRSLLRDAVAGIVGDSELWTSTNQSNTVMQSLLESEGFKQTGKIDNLDPGDPELVYFTKR